MLPSEGEEVELQLVLVCRQRLGLFSPLVRLGLDHHPQDMALVAGPEP